MRPPQEDFANIFDSFLHLDDYVAPNLSDYVKGPANAFDNNIAIYDLATGKLIKDSGTSIANINAVAYFDATIGVGGQYSEPSTAIAAGKYRLKVVGNVALTTDNNISEDCYIDLNGFTINCGAFGFIIPTTKCLTLRNTRGVGNITFSYSASKALFHTTAITSKVNHDVYGITINNNSTAAICTIAGTGNVSNHPAGRGLIDKCILNIPNYSICGFYYAAETVTNSIINGAGTGATNTFWNDGTGGFILENITLTGTFGGIFIYAGFVKNITSSLNISIFANSGFDGYITPNGTVRSGSYKNCEFYIEGIFGFNGTIDNSKIYNTQLYSYYTAGSFLDNLLFRACTFLNNINFKLYVSTHRLGAKGTSCIFNGTVIIEQDSMFLRGTIFKSNLTISGKNNEIDGHFTGNIALAGTASSTKLTGKALGTISLAAGVMNCDINVGVTAGTQIKGSDGLPFILGGNVDISNKINFYILS